MRVLVTGGAGFIGSHIVDLLLAQGHTPLVVDDLSSGKRSNLPDDVELVVMDIRDPQLIEVAASFRPDAISHCAAQASVAVSMKEPVRDADINILGGLNVVRAAQESGCSQFVYITTGGALYGIPEYLPCDEDHPIRPLSAYGLSKWTLEQYLGILLAGSMPVKVLRLANIYGPRQDPHGEAGVVSIFASRMLAGEPVTIFGDGEQTRDFVYVGDVARAHDLALGSGEPLAVNISTETPLTVNELFRIMAEQTGYGREPIHAGERAGDLKHSVLSNARARRLLGWEPRMPIEEGLRETLAWAREG
ncbi:MAG: NAD-dependent epimerase/dehydratase family protein [Hyphomicrobiales bacterium]|nr:NAD-dependent epimerase/dehydratase family protein [Hyphomicrobiales bacterium]